jgi:hypothetical protein
MSPYSAPKPGVSPVDQQPTINITATHIISVSRIDRWRVYHRLQELMIPCWCLEDGSLRVEVQNGLCALLLRSVVQQFVASRLEMVNWLERCWDAGGCEG